MSDERVPLQVAVDFIRAARPGQRTLTILKALIGNAAAGHLNPRAARFRSKAFPLEAGPLGMIALELDPNDPIPLDFWTHGLAGQFVLNQAYKQDRIVTKRLLQFSQIPYRLRRSHSSEQTFELWDEAEFITFDLQDIAALTCELDWRKWVDHFYKARKSGPTPAGHWDWMKANLTAAAARDPTILDEGVGALVQRMQTLFDAVGFCTDSKEIRAYAKQVKVAWETGYDPPPTD